MERKDLVAGRAVHIEIQTMQNGSKNSRMHRSRIFIVCTQLYLTGNFDSLQYAFDAFYIKKLPH
jgi:hypothetical protein